MTHQCSHERAPASAHASAHASVHESAHKSWLNMCYNPIQRLPVECSRECSHRCPHKCTQSGLVACHLVCFTCWSSHSENHSLNSERDLLREYPGTLRELREWPLHSESVFFSNWGGPQASDYLKEIQSVP